MAFIYDGKPTQPGTKIGQTKQSNAIREGGASGGTTVDKYWEWTGREWVEISKTKYQSSVGGIIAAAY